MSKANKVFVGLSGGVDSAASAALLKDQGNDVTGVYMKNWSRDVAGHHCPWQEDLASARSVAAHLQIPFKIYDFEKEYFDAVTSYMLESYQKGQTPNPDVMCNQKIKFDTFFNKCLADGAEFVATGHYATMQDGRLMKAKDSNKDQTYFLYRINPSIAQKVLFPLGELPKPKVRELAKKFGLPNSERPDSQGLCFVGNVPMRDFLSEFITPKVGDIVDENGTKLGQHNGAFSYTIGQRHGLGIGGGQPYFVYEVDTKANIVRVTSDENSALLNKSEFEISDCVWWGDIEMEKMKQEKWEVRVRYRSKSIPCSIISTSSARHPVPEASGGLDTVSRQKNKQKQISNPRINDGAGKDRDDKFTIKLSHPERAIAPGQSAVFYDGDLVVGGGIIQ